MANKKLTMVRHLDNLGRLVIPIELRKAMGISKGDPVQMEVNGNTLTVKKHEDSCMICGKSGDLFNVHENKKICSGCIKKISELNIGE